VHNSGGKQYLDLTSGWNVANVGWQNPAILEAFIGQTNKLAFCPSWCWHDIRSQLNREVTSLVDGRYEAIGCCTGAEAVESALKIAKRATGRHAVVGFKETYHGSTLGALSVGGVPGFRGVDLPQGHLHRFLALPENGATRLELDAALRKVVWAEPHPAAILLEPIFTNPGVIEGPHWFYESIAAAAKLVGALLIVDEVGTGLGRTGRMFAYEHFPVVPDLIVMGKALGGAVAPISAVLAKPEYADIAKGLAFDSSYAWNPAACAAAIATLQFLKTQGLVSRARELGQQAVDALRSELQGAYPVEVLGRGLELAVRFPSDEGGAKKLRVVIKSLFDHGIFIEQSRYMNSLLIMPPLTIALPQFEAAISLISETCRQTIGSN